MRAALVALAALAAVTAGAALAVPVPVLTVTDGTSEFLAPLEDGEPMRFSYRQSIYEVPVLEEFRRDGDRMALLRVRSSDVRSIEYLRWDGAIKSDGDGLWYQDAPRSDTHELVIRIAPLGQQRFTTARWACDLLGRFGPTVVRVRAERRVFAQLLVAGALGR